ncbi:MAG: carboxypeptidase-like regulatory domain-containing protein [Tannerella sp.]|jgi:hypothetical protein|nr:carboxypeptidase-like regulatory domain-containing protein [Tannerella sp.]
MTETKHILRRMAACLALLSVMTTAAAGDGDSPLDRRIRMEAQKGTVYRLLKEVSVQSGFMFIYDSRTVDNDRAASISGGEYTLRDAIRIITRKPALQIDVTGNHILLRPPAGSEPQTDTDERPADRNGENHRVIHGSLHDLETKEPVVYATVSLLNTSVGTVSNQHGEFRLVIPDSLRHPVVRFSHIGYESRETDASLLAGQTVDFPLEPKVIPLQEVEVRRVNPIREISEMLRRRDENYPSAPTCLTAFYREGIEHRRKPIDLSESVLEIYKTGYRSDASGDHVKLIRKRRITHVQAGDTILPKMKSGIHSCLILDIVKELPDFIVPGDESLYDYAHEEVSAIDNRLVNVISFRQKPQTEEPLFSGELYIENSRKALEEIRFEVNPEYVDKATNLFIDRKAHNLKLSLRKAAYIVSYKPLHPHSPYYVSHVRGDILFRVRKKGHIFSTPLHFWFEMVTCRIDTVGVHPVPRHERLSPNRIFAETVHAYDRDFWENFNIILPEEKLKETIIHSLSEVIIQEQ